MSKNFPHDNIYSILGKLESLQPTPQEKHDALVQQIRESVEAKGSVLEGVSSVEARLAKQFAEGFGDVKDWGGHVANTLDPRRMNQVTMAPQAKKPAAKTAASVAAQMKSKGASADVGSLTRAAKAAGYAESEKTCNECGMTFEGCGCDDKMEEGKVHKGDYGYRDKQDTEKKDMKGPKSNDPFGRTPDTPPSGKEGRKIKGKADPHNDSGDAGHWGESLERKLQKISEGINFADMMKETDMTVGEMLSELQNDINTFKKTGHCSDKLEAFLKIHNHGKKIVTDGVGNPRGYPPGPAGQDAMALNPDFRAPAAKPGIMQRAASAVGAGVNKAVSALGHGSDDDLLRDLARKSTMEDAELNELARLAGLNVAESRDLPGNQDRLDVAEPKGQLTAADFDRLRGDIDEADMDEASRGEYISQQDDAAEKAGRNKFSAFGQTFDTDEVEEASRGDYISQQDDAAEKAGRDEFSAFGQTFDTDEVEECDMPGVPGMEKDGNISVSTTQNTDGNKSVNISADGSAVDELMQMLKIAGLAGNDAGSQAMSQPAGVEVHAEPVEVGVGDEGIEEEFANEPHETYGTVKNITSQGDDMNRPKKQDARTANRAANPFTNDDDILALESSLAAEYESIKKAK